MDRDYSRWAKKFDDVAHIYNDNGHGTMCGSVAACLGNNYATTDMKTCPKCQEIKQGKTVSQMERVPARPKKTSRFPEGYKQKILFHKTKVSNAVSFYDVAMMSKDYENAEAHLMAALESIKSLTYFVHNQLNWHEDKRKEQ